MGVSIGIFTKPWNRAQVNTSGNITLDMLNRQLREFNPSAAIAAPKTWILENASKAFEFRYRFTLSGLHVQTMPANFRMTDPMFNTSNQQWTPLDIGEYEAHGTFDGTNWNLTIVGLWT